MSMNNPLLADPLPLKIEPSGVMRIGATRVSLESAIHAYRRGLSPEQIVEQYDTLDLGDVYAIISYYLHHRQQIDEYVASRSEELDRFESESIASGGTPTGLRERFRSRLAESKPPCSQ
jgi:uncharacterized protein (DUF433 family)